MESNPFNLKCDIGGVLQASPFILQFYIICVIMYMLTIII